MDGRIDLYPVIDLLVDTVEFSCLIVHILFMFMIGSIFHFFAKLTPHKINSFHMMHVGITAPKIMLGELWGCSFSGWVSRNQDG